MNTDNLNFDNKNDVNAYLQDRAAVFTELCSTVTTANKSIVNEERDLHRGRTEDDEFTYEMMMIKRREFTENFESIYQGLINNIINFTLSSRTRGYKSAQDLITDINNTYNQNDNIFIQNFTSEFSNLYYYLNNINISSMHINDPEAIFQFLHKYINVPTADALPYFDNAEKGGKLRGPLRDCPATQKSIKRSLEIVLCFKVAFGDYFDLLERTG